MCITLDNGTFYAPLDAPFKDELVRYYWFRDERSFYTRELDRVLPVIEYLHPDLQKLLVETETSYAYSTALEPSPDMEFVVADNGQKLYGYQLSDAEFIIKHKDTLLAEEAGTGKSAIMVTAANTLGCRNILIICPAIAKYNWALKEWPKWSTLTHLSVGIAEGDYLPPTDVVIINYDILDRHKVPLQEVEWDLMIVDEAHRIRNEDAKRTVMVLGGTLSLTPRQAVMCGADMGASLNDAEFLASNRKRVFSVPELRAKKRVFATATPLDKPIHLWTLARACDPHGLGKDKREFERRYCEAHMTPFGWNNSGAAHLTELGGRLRSTFMVRHDPEQILDLPPLREEIFLLPPVKAILKQEDNFVHENIEALLSFAKASGIPNALSEKSSTQDFMRLIGEAVITNVDLIGEPEFKPLFSKFAIIRKETGIAKVPYIVDFTRDITRDGERPIVLFAYHREVIFQLREAFPEAAVVIGGMTAKARNKQVDRFQDGETNWFIGNIDAAGEAVTLTRADLLAITEPDWRPTAISQARKRIHRITQNKPCSVFHLASANSFDSIVSENVFERIQHVKETMAI